MHYEKEDDEPHSRAFVMGQLARRRQEASGQSTVNPFKTAINRDAFFQGYCEEHDIIRKEKGEPEQPGVEIHRSRYRYSEI